MPTHHRRHFRRTTTLLLCTLAFLAFYVPHAITASNHQPTRYTDTPTSPR